MKKSVGAIIYKDNKYLIQRRSKKKKIYFPDIHGVFGGGVNNNEKTLHAIKREILEELELNLSLKNIRYFLQISLNSRHFKTKRSRSYFSIKITNDQYKLINLREGQSLHLLNVNKIKKLDFVPWDLAAILYFDSFIKNNKQVKPT